MRAPGPAAGDSYVRPPTSGTPATAQSPPHKEPTPELLASKPEEPTRADPPTAGKTEASISAAVPLPDYERLLQRDLGMPLPGLKAKDLYDTFAESRGGTRAHEATDILAPKGTPVLAVDSGAVKKIFNSARGGLTVYQFDSEGLYCYYYAHLDRYAENLKEGMFLNRGDLIGYVGTTGNAPEGTPHLHFAIFKLGPEKLWWKGTPINAYSIFMALARQREK